MTIIKSFIVSLWAALLLGGMAQAEEKTFHYEVDGKHYEGYLISQDKSRPLVLLLHDWDGLTDYEIERARMLAEKGLNVIVADLFGAGIRPTELKDKKQHTGELYKNRDLLRQLMMGALDAVAQQGLQTQNKLAIGYCFGGAAVLELARSGVPMHAFVSFHGGLSTPEGQTYENTVGKVVVFHGSADKAISLDQLAQLGQNLEQHKIPHELHSYGGADHAFTVFDGARYHAEADRLSWKRFMEIIDDWL